MEYRSFVKGTPLRQRCADPKSYYKTFPIEKLQYKTSSELCKPLQELCDEEAMVKKCDTVNLAPEPELGSIYTDEHKYLNRYGWQWLGGRRLHESNSISKQLTQIAISAKRDLPKLDAKDFDTQYAAFERLQGAVGALRPAGSMMERATKLSNRNDGSSYKVVYPVKIDSEIKRQIQQSRDIAKSLTDAIAPKTQKFWTKHEPVIKERRKLSDLLAKLKNSDRVELSTYMNLKSESPKNTAKVEQLRETATKLYELERRQLKEKYERYELEVKKEMARTMRDTSSSLMSGLSQSYLAFQTLKDPFSGMKARIKSYDLENWKYHGGGDFVNALTLMHTHAKFRENDELRKLADTMYVSWTKLTAERQKREQRAAGARAAGARAA